MRWPWQRAPEVRRADAAPAPSPAGWAFLPPLVEAAPASPSILRTDFVTRLPTRAVPVQLTSLGHLVTDDAPRATIGLDASPAQSEAAATGGAERSAAAELTLSGGPKERPAREQRPTTSARSVQRAATEPAAVPPAPRVGPSPDAGEPGGGDRSTHPREQAVPAQRLAEAPPVEADAPVVDADAPGVEPDVVGAEPDRAIDDVAIAPLLASATSGLGDVSDPPAAPPARDDAGSAPTIRHLATPLRSQSFAGELPSSSEAVSRAGARREPTPVVQRAAADAPARALPDASAGALPDAPADEVVDAPVQRRPVLGLGAPLPATREARPTDDPPVVQRSDAAGGAPAPPDVARRTSGSAVVDVDTAPSSSPIDAPIDAPSTAPTAAPSREARGTEVAPIVGDARATLAGGDATSLGDLDRPGAPRGLGAPLQRTSARGGPESMPFVAPVDARGALTADRVPAGASSPLTATGASESEPREIDAPAPPTARTEFDPSPPAPDLTGEVAPADGRVHAPADTIVPLILQRRLAPGMQAVDAPLARPGAPNGVALRAPAVPAQVLPGHAVLPGVEQPAGAGAGAARGSLAPSPPVQRRAQGTGDAAPRDQAWSGTVGDVDMIASGSLPGAATAAATMPLQRTAASADLLRDDLSSRAIARSPAAPSPASIPGVDSAQLRAVQRVLARNATRSETPEHAEAPVDVQREEAIEADSAASGDQVAPPPERPASAASPSATAPGGVDASDPQTPAQVQKLVDRIYAPIVRRLKAEMLIDRERRGVRIDRI